MAILKRHKSSIHGLTEDLFNLNQAIVNEATARAEADGDLTELATDTQENLVAAINEVLVTATASEGSLKIEENLADLADVAEARNNLEVMSAAEVAAAIEVAQVEMGTNFTVGSLQERDALEGLDLGDRVMVEDDGDGKWAIYAPKFIEDGAVTAWTKLYDQDALENSLTAAGIKAAYESNEDTNVFTDAEKAKLEVALVEDDIVTEIDLDNEEQAGPAGVGAVKYFVAEQIAAAESTTIGLEQVTVNGNLIVLTEAPVNGVAGVLNFATVRHIDVDGIAYDAPVLATAEPKEFTISTDTVDQWDGKLIQVQYVYVK